MTNEERVVVDKALDSIKDNHPEAYEILHRMVVQEGDKDGEYIEMEKDEYTTMVVGLAKFKKLADDSLSKLNDEIKRSEKLENEIHKLEKRIEKIEEKNK